MKKQAVVALILLSVPMFLFQNCGKAPGTSPVAETTPKPVPDGNNDDQKIDPWNAPVGELVQGATLLDGWTDLRVLPYPVNIPGGWTDSPAISNDGMTLYFSYGRFELLDTINGIWPPTVTGEARPGMTGNDMKNFKATFNKSGWTVSYMPAPINDPDVTKVESSISANATENLFIWTRWNLGPPLTASLWFSYRQANGTWTPAATFPAPINGANCINDNGFVVGDPATGVDIYWESDRTDLACTSGGAKKHIYHSYFNASTQTFSAVELVPGVNGTVAGEEDQQFSVTHDKKHAYWTATRANPGDYALYTADLVGNAYLNARPIVRPNMVSPFSGKLTWLGEINVTETPQGWLAYFNCGIATNESPPGYGQHFWLCRMKKPKPADYAASKKINTAGWSDSPFISRDGQRLYFMYSRWDFSPLFLPGGGAPVLRGPDRLGLNKNAVNPFDESDIYVSYKNADGTWGEPVNLGLNGAYGDASGMEYNNGNSFIWLQGNGATNNIVMVTKNANGTWGSIVDPGPAINSSEIEDNPFISDDGNNIWFSSKRAGGLGDKDFWFSSKSGGVWSNPVNLGPTFNTAGEDDQAFLPNGGNTLDVYWNSPSGLKHCISNGVGCQATPETITFAGCDVAAEISMPDTQDIAYFGCGTISTGRVKIMYSVKQPNGSWGPATPVD